MVPKHIIFSPLGFGKSGEDHLPELPRESDHCFGFRFCSVSQLKTTVERRSFFLPVFSLWEGGIPVYSSTDRVIRFIYRYAMSFSIRLEHFFLPLEHETDSIHNSVDEIRFICDLVKSHFHHHHSNILPVRLILL